MARRSPAPARRCTPSAALRAGTWHGCTAASFWSPGPTQATSQEAQHTRPAAGLRSAALS
eukprot:365768-Chlamydomonas_euryale.AAC.5